MTAQEIAQVILTLGGVATVAFLVNLYGDWDDRRRFGG